MVTNKKSSNVRKTATMSAALSAYANAHGVSVIDRMKDPVATPAIESRVKVTVFSNIVDNYEGQTETHTIWGETTNKDFVARALAARGREKDSILVSVAKFLIERRLALVVNDLVKTPTLRPSDQLLTKSDLYRGLLKAADDVAVAQVIMELVLPVLIKWGTVSANGRFASQDTYAFKRVEVSDLTTEIAVIQAFSALDMMKVDRVARDVKQSRSVFAETVAEMFRPVGLVLAQVPELSVVLSDIVNCVRAQITPTGSVGSESVDVSSAWAANAQVAELSQCLPFVRAALAIPAATQVRVATDPQTLENWLKLVVQMLRDTPRYKWVSNAEALRHYGLRKIRTLTDEPVSLIAYRSVAAEATAQTVSYSDDALLADGAVFISATRDRVADTIKAAYGAANFSTESSVDLLEYVTSGLTELGYEGWQGGLLIDAWGNGLTLSDIAVLSSQDVYVQFNDAMEVIINSESNQFDPVWWFKVDTQEKQLVVRSGRHLGTEVLTCDPIEALLAGRTFDPRDVMPPRKQLLGPNAFNATVTNFDKKAMLQSLSTRMQFQIPIAGQTMDGALRAQDFASLHSISMAGVVRPFFNERVIMAAQEAYIVALQIIQLASASGDVDWNSGVRPDVDTMKSLSDVCVRRLLQLAQRLSPGFRNEVQEVVTDRVLASDKAVGERAQMLRARMMQPVYAARCDLLAFQFFMHLQGIAIDDWGQLIGSPEMAQACGLFGTSPDREKSRRTLI